VIGPWFVALAYAGIVVEAPTDCFEREQVALEVGAVVDDAVLQRLDLVVIVHGDQLTMNLRDGSELLWSKMATITQADCSVVPKLVARSVEQAVAELPRWVFANGARPPERSLSILAAPLPLGSLPRWELRGAGSGPIAGRARWAVGLGVAAEGLRSDSAYRANILEALVRAGPGVDLGTGQHSLRLTSTLGVGPALVVASQDASGGGRALDSGWAPAVRVELDATWVGPGPWRLGVVGSLSAIEVISYADDRQLVAKLPLARVGVVVGAARVR
jgi:hypothetical protein